MQDCGFIKLLINYCNPSAFIYKLIFTKRRSLIMNPIPLIKFNSLFSPLSYQRCTFVNKISITTRNDFMQLHKTKTGRQVLRLLSLCSSTCNHELLFCCNSSGRERYQQVALLRTWKGQQKKDWWMAKAKWQSIVTINAIRGNHYFYQNELLRLGASEPDFGIQEHTLSWLRVVPCLCFSIIIIVIRFSLLYSCNGKIYKEWLRRQKPFLSRQSQPQ